MLNIMESCADNLTYEMRELVRERRYFYKREAYIRRNLLLLGKCAHSQYIAERKREMIGESVYLSVVVIIVSDDLVGLMIREMYGGNSLKTRES